MFGKLTERVIIGSVIFIVIVIVIVTSGTRPSQENADNFIRHDASTSPNREWALAHALFSELGVQRADRTSESLSLSHVAGSCRRGVGHGFHT